MKPFTARPSSTSCTCSASRSSGAAAGHAGPRARRRRLRGHAPGRRAAPGARSRHRPHRLRGERRLAWRSSASDCPTSWCSTSRCPSWTASDAAELRRTHPDLPVVLFSSLDERRGGDAGRALARRDGLRLKPTVARWRGEAYVSRTSPRWSRSWPPPRGHGRRSAAATAADRRARRAGRRRRGVDRRAGRPQRASCGAAAIPAGARSWWCSTCRRCSRACCRAPRAQLALTVTEAAEGDRAAAGPRLPRPRRAGTCAWSAVGAACTSRSGTVRRRTPAGPPRTCCFRAAAAVYGPACSPWS
jgi:hypothetical protein